jgi:quercetin dioxygenase-like cupin family protein
MANTERAISGKEKTLYVLGDFYTFKATGRDTDDNYSIIEITVPPESGPPLHIHKNEDEGVYVLEGLFSIRNENNIIKGTKGTYAFLRRLLPHTYRNIGDVAGKLLITITPPGFEKFFEEAGIAVTRKDVASLSVPSTPVDIEEKVLRMWKKYDVEVILPNPTGFS